MWLIYQSVKTARKGNWCSMNQLTLSPTPAGASLCPSNTPSASDTVFGRTKPRGTCQLHHTLLRAAAKFPGRSTPQSRTIRTSPAVCTCLAPTQPSKEGFQNHLDISYKQILGEPAQTWWLKFLRKAWFYSLFLIKITPSGMQYSKNISSILRDWNYFWTSQPELIIYPVVT